MKTPIEIKIVTHCDTYLKYVKVVVTGFTAARMLLDKLEADQ